MTNIESHLRTLIRLALSDQNFADVERNVIYKLAQIHKVDKDAVDELIKQEFSRDGSNEAIEFTSLTFDQRFEYLYNLVHLMKADNKVFLSEIRFCEDIAQKLGFLKESVKILSSNIFSDPKITVDRENLKRELRKMDFS